MAEIILHHYPRSPFAEKVRVALGLKGLRWRSVTIPNVMPKPDLVALTGGYRRTPVLQVGADVFCDTLLILRALERLRPSPTLFPEGSDALATLVGWGFEKAVFHPTIGIVVGLIGRDYPRVLIEDRGPFFGWSLEHADNLALQATFADRLNAQFALLGRLLGDGRPYLLGREPGAADLCCYHPLWHLRRAGGVAEAARTVLDLLPTLRPLLPWMDRIAAIGHGSPTELDAADALAIARAATPAPIVEDGTAAPLTGLAPGDAVTVAADDTGRDPVAGTLVAATADEIVIARRDERAGDVHVHVPRAGFDAARA